MTTSSESVAYDGVALVHGMSALAERYDGFILDQWGVLHDGTRPYAGAAECLERLHVKMLGQQLRSFVAVEHGRDALADSDALKL